jgi:hypothetical protein
MSQTSISDGAGCQWWSHVGVNALETTTYPGDGQGSSEAADADSDTYGAHVTVIYKIHVVTGQVGDTLAVDCGGPVVGLTALPIATTGAEYEFPGGMRVEHASNANLSVTTQDDSTVTIFYRRIA